MSDIIRDAIAESAGEGSFVTNWIAIAEVTDTDGETSIHTISDCDHAWQVLGMLHHARLVTEQNKYGREQG